MKGKFSGFKMICIAKLKCLRLESYSVRKSIQFNKKSENVYFLISSGSKDMYCADQINVVMLLPTYKQTFMGF